MIFSLILYFDKNDFLALEAGEMMSLEDEISHLQKENSRIESQLSRWLGHHHHGGDNDGGGGDVGYDGDTEDDGDGMKRKEKERVLLRMKGDVSSTEGEVAADDRVFHFCHISPNLQKLRNHHLYLVLSPSIEPLQNLAGSKWAQAEER